MSKLATHGYCKLEVIAKLASSLGNSFKIPVKERKNVLSQFSSVFLGFIISNKYRVHNLDDYS